MDKNSLLSLFYSVIHLSKLKVILRHIFRITEPKYSNKLHLRETINWLCRAQDRWECGGVAAKYGFYGDWGPPYQETTGYIIPTFISYAEVTDENAYLERAIKMGDWEINVQLQSGAVKGGYGIEDYPVVFNTGMVILGWVSVYQKTGFERYLNASVRAADWLCSVIDDDGKWSRYSYNNIAHSYYSRVSWALLTVYEISGNERFKDAAVKNIKWVLSNVKENGWIEEMGFYKGDESPLTHTIAYTLRGLLEASFLLDDEMRQKTRGVVIKAGEKLHEIYETFRGIPNKKIDLLPARISSDWKPAANYSCLTGNAQIAIIWFKLFQLTRETKFFTAAQRISESLKMTHDLKARNKGIRGAISGSLPVWGGYLQFAYPNWAAKFFADALMIQEKILKENPEMALNQKQVTQ